MHRRLPAIRFREEDVKHMCVIEKHLLVGKFSNGRPSLDAIRRFFATNFILKASFQVGLLDHRHVTLAGFLT